jgi:hypothetical protein
VQVLYETTAWSDGTDANHVYFMNDSKEKMYAYVTRGSLDVFQFKRPIRINTRGRTFITVPNIWNFNAEDEVVEPKLTWEFTGSQGNKYLVTKDGAAYNCTCPGYTYRGECKHVKEIENGS